MEWTVSGVWLVTLFFSAAGFGLLFAHLSEKGR
jgi:hypothetical protein